MALRLALFDVDGTLVDGQRNIVAAMRCAFSSDGLEPPAPQDIRRLIGLSVETCVRRLAPGLEDRRVFGLSERFKESFADLRSSPAFEEPTFEGALEALRTLDRDGWLLGLATGKSRRGVNALLERLELENFFVAIETSDVNPSKPHPQMIINAARSAGAELGRTVMVGDTVFDAQMAVNAGAFAVGVSWGYHEAEELAAAGASAVAAEFRCVPSLLSKLVGEAECEAVLS